MSESSTSRLDLADELKPTVPTTDDKDAASELLNYVLVRTLRMNHDIRGHADQRYDQAPASSRHVLDLNAEISSVVLDWIRRWPS